MVIGLDVHKRSVYGTVMEDNEALIVQRNMENNMEMVNGFLSLYKDHDIVIESSTSGKYLCKELLMLDYMVHLINPSKVPEISNNYKKTDKEEFGKRRLKEIENSYSNLNYSDKIVLRSLLNDISFIDNVIIVL